MFGTFQEAILARHEGGDRRYALSGPGFESDEGDPNAWQPPGMVLRDEHGNELWLSGCFGGYRGTAPHGAGYILLKEGFPHEQIRLVLTCDLLHLAKGGAPLVAKRNPDKSELAEDAHFVEQLLDAEANGYFQSLQEA